jgi:hypothetical protein
MPTIYPTLQIRADEDAGLVRCRLVLDGTVIAEISTLHIAAAPKTMKCSMRGSRC